MSDKTKIEKVVRIGDAGDGMVFCKIKFENSRLSISGVEGPTRDGNCIGGCGQIDMHLRGHEENFKFVDGWDVELARKFFDVWERWHLNDMKAGTPAQMQWLRENEVKGGYDANCKALESAGLNPDNGYKYGSAWLREEVPMDVLEFLEALPESSVVPAWV